jgi:hypothetical protein
MRHETKRFTKNNGSKKRLFSASHTRGGRTVFYRKQKMRKKKFEEGFVLLFSQSFLCSLNRAIQHIEKIEITPLQSLSNYDISDFEKFLGWVKLPSLEEEDFQPLTYQSHLILKLKQLYDLDVVFEKSNDYDTILTMPELKPIQDFNGWWCINYEEVDSYFKLGYAVIILMTWMYLLHHGQMGDFCVHGVDTLSNWLQLEIQDYDEDDSMEYKELKQSIESKLRAIGKSETRYDDLYKYLKTDIELKVITEIFDKYATEEERCVMQHLSKWFGKLDQFTKHWDEWHQPYVENSNLFDTVSWAGNREIFKEHEQWLNEDFGNEGYKIDYKYPNSYGNNLDEEMITMWQSVKGKPLMRNPIEEYFEIITNLYDDTIIKKFDRLPNKSQFLVDLHRGLDGMSGGDKRCGERWKGVATATGFSGVFKEAYRFFGGKRKSNL